MNWVGSAVLDRSETVCDEVHMERHGRLATIPHHHFVPVRLN